MKKVFQTTEILDIVWDRLVAAGLKDVQPEDVLWAILDNSEHLYMDEFEEVCTFVFEHEGKHWQIEFEQNNGAGWNQILGKTWDIKKPWEPECKKFTATEVRKVTKTIVSWVPVEDK